jgi:diguanylate cyclase (GGDEF)-like protein
MLYRLAENAAAALEILYLKEIINEYVIIDDVTGMYSRKFFVERMEEELQRANESGNELSMLVISMDRAHDLETRYSREGFERVMTALAKVVRASVRPYDVVGRFDDHAFSVLLIHTAASDAYLWAEKIRKSIAAYVINLDGRSFSITISTGVCGGIEGMKKDELLGSAMTVLSKACEAGGNAVRVF